MIAENLRAETYLMQYCLEKELKKQTATLYLTEWLTHTQRLPYASEGSTHQGL